MTQMQSDEAPGSDFIAALTLNSNHIQTGIIDMNNDEAPVFIFKKHDQAEAAIRLLMKSGFAADQISLIGKGFHSEDKPVGFYSAGDRIKAWGGMGAFWGGLWALLVSPAVFMLPGLGVVALAGPFVAVLVGVLEGAVVVGGFSALGAALMQFGVPKDDVVKYESAVAVDSYVLMIHGTPEEIGKARELLDEQPATEAA